MSTAISRKQWHTTGFAYFLPKNLMKFDRIENRYRTERAETLRVRQDLRATGEGASGVAESSHDDDTQVSEGGHRTQLRRGFLKTSKRKREKKKLRRNDVVIGTWNVRTMLVEGK